MGVALVPVAFVAAMLVGEGVGSLLGYESGTAAWPSVEVFLLAGLPATVIGLAPALFAVVNGRRAEREGEPQGLVPTVIGAVVALYWVAAPVLTGVVGLFG
jgi:F0F1-type ATP synthase assembly protein I